MRFFDAGGKRAVWVVHRRGGKDLTAMHQLCKMAHQRIGAYWHVFPTAEQARKAIWEGFLREGTRTMENVFPRAIRKSPRTWTTAQEMVVELECGSIYRVLGSDNIEVVGAGPVGVIFSEYSLAKPQAWNLIAPMLAENDGWAAFVFTPRGNNHGKRLFDLAQTQPGWFCDLKTLYDTKAYDPEATIAAERAGGRPEALIRQEYLCDWTAANVGGVWGDLIETLEKSGAVAEFSDFDKARVFTVWDLGGSGAHGDATCFWIWAAREDGVDLLDYYENHGKPLSHYWDEVTQREQALGVKAHKHWMPHDARARHLTGVSVLEQCAKHWGLERVAIYPEDSLLNGIQAGRWLLQQRVRIHPRCVEGLDALKAYHYAWDENRRVFSNQPEHDFSSHPADAFRGLALVYRESAAKTRPPDVVQKPCYVVPVRPTMDQLFEQAGPSGSGRI